jgi:hypothetical protein
LRSAASSTESRGGGLSANCPPGSKVGRAAATNSLLKDRERLSGATGVVSCAGTHREELDLKSDALRAAAARKQRFNARSDVHGPTR